MVGNSSSARRRALGPGLAAAALLTSTVVAVLAQVMGAVQPLEGPHEGTACRLRLKGFPPEAPLHPLAEPAPLRETAVESGLSRHRCAMA